jgi:hypothetical protein
MIFQRREGVAGVFGPSGEGAERRSLAIGPLAQDLSDDRHAFAAFRLDAQKTVETGDRTFFLTGRSPNLSIGNGIAQTNIHAVGPSHQRLRRP